MQTHTKNLLLFMILATLIGGALYSILFWQIRSKNELSSKLVNDIDLGEQKDSRLSSLRKIVADTKEVREKLQTFLLSPDQTVGFIESIETLGKNSGLTIKTSDVSTLPTADSFPLLQLKVETSGSWENTVYFLKRLEDQPYNIQIKDMSLTQTTSDAVSEKGKVISTKTVWNTTVTFLVTESK